MVPPRLRQAFTLLELLVVIVIILLISAVTLPAVLPAIGHREINEAARILQAQLAQARDTAIRFNAPRGVRFLPDPTYGNSLTILAYNRMVPLEPAPLYSNGQVTIWPQAFDAAGAAQPWTNPATPYPSGYGVGGGGSGYYPVGPPGPNNTANTTNGQVLVIEQAPYQANDTTQFINPPTSWYWNIRVGDQLQIGTTGQPYTIVGPCTINPFSSGGANPEMFINVGPPGDLSKYLTRQYTDSAGKPGIATPVEFLYLVNGVDDLPKDGYVDNGWDGVDNNGGATGQYVYNGLIDDLGSAGTTPVASEWEIETWLGTLSTFNNPIAPQTVGSFATPTSAKNTTGFGLLPPTGYTITRRPMPSQAGRETMLPNNVVIDATTALPLPMTSGSWVATRERSRLPVDRWGRYCDIMLLPSGQVVPTTLYSSPTSFGFADAFYHFWLAERPDVHEASELWGLGKFATPPPAQGLVPNPNSGMSFVLPLPQDAYTYWVQQGNSFTSQPQIALKGERMMVTLFSRTGKIASNSIEFTGSPLDPGFSVTDVNAPYYDSQFGIREAK